MIQKSARLAGKSNNGRTDQDRPVFVLTCEHGGHRIPVAYRDLFSGAGDVLKSHRGWDPGALRVAEAMSGMLGATLFSSNTSRLLIELNRSFGHRSLFSEFTASLSVTEKQKIVEKYWQPYRDEVTTHIDNLVNTGCNVIHLSIHSFTPVWEGIARPTSIGLLYDPRRPHERSFCEAWKTTLRQQQSDHTIHSNQPYRGIADGFTTSLRRRFDAERGTRWSYIGVEVEINQSLIYPSATRQIKSIATLLCQRHIASQ